MFEYLRHIQIEQYSRVVSTQSEQSLFGPIGYYYCDIRRIRAGQMGVYQCRE